MPALGKAWIFPKKAKRIHSNRVTYFKCLRCDAEYDSEPKACSMLLDSVKCDSREFTKHKRKD